MTAGKKEDKAAQKQDRRAEALRENLRRRKTQARTRDEAAIEPETPEKAEGEDSPA